VALPIDQRGVSSWPAAAPDAARRAYLEDMRETAYPDGATVIRAESAIGADLPARRPATPVILCDGHGAGFVTVTRQILMAVHT
jgi:hypothetical protein